MCVFVWLYVEPVSRWKDYVRSWITIGLVVCLCTPVSPSVPEMEGIYATEGGGGGGGGGMGAILLQSPGRWVGLSQVSQDASAGPGEIRRREVVLDPQVRPEEIKGREMELGLRVGLLLLQLFPNGGATDIVFVTLFCIAVGTAIQCVDTVVDEQRRADTALTFRCSGGGPRQPRSSGVAPVSRPHSLLPYSSPSPNKPYGFCGR